MPCHPNDPLCPFTADEEEVFGHSIRSRSVPAVLVKRVKLLAVAAGASFSGAARANGRSNNAVAHRVSRFNREGRAAFPDIVAEPNRATGQLSDNALTPPPTAGAAQPRSIPPAR